MIADWSRDRVAELHDTYSASLRAHYTIVIEEPEPGDEIATLPQQGEGQAE